MSKWKGRGDFSDQAAALHGWSMPAAQQGETSRSRQWDVKIQLSIIVIIIVVWAWPGSPAAIPACVTLAALCRQSRITYRRRS
ncbi:hypothetical protein AB0O47_19045 [Streptomyces noursei]|uniref:hypothetical protein n=1 Tax=Streptomyces noursei TaxID=1971 RepID=UPI00045EFCAA|nr:hypothetical protein [Streptomyces noursei]AIA06574.1 hypothetical protein DC74_6133 [Streptomyces noursei]